MIAATLARAKAPFVRSLLENDDVDVHAACLREWGQSYDQLTAGAFRGVFEEVCFGNVQLFREGFNQAVYESGSPWHGSRTVGVATTAEGEGRFRGKPFGLDAVIDLRGGDELDFRTPRRHEIVAVVVPVEALEAYARRVEHLDLAAHGAHSDLITTVPAQAAAFRALLLAAFARLAAAPEALASDAVRRGLEHRVLGGVLATLRRPRERPVAPSRRARQLIVERARAHLRDHIDEPVSVEDLCSHLGVSRRTLQYSFQDIIGLNPVRFLRVTRLNGARRDLKRADPKADTVTGIAARWGFWHLSRFAIDYRLMFGEPPSETLKRGGGGLAIPPPVAGAPRRPESRGLRSGPKPDPVG